MNPQYGLGGKVFYVLLDYPYDILLCGAHMWGFYFILL